MAPVGGAEESPPRFGRGVPPCTEAPNVCVHELEQQSSATRPLGQGRKKVGAVGDVGWGVLGRPGATRCRREGRWRGDERPQRRRSAKITGLFNDHFIP